MEQRARRSLVADRDIRVALIGYGLGGRSFHAPVISAVPGLRLTTIVTSNPERATQARTEFPGAVVVSDADTVWLRRAEVDVVVISTPNRTHVPLAMAALESGLHVVVDKPLAPTSAAARMLAAEASTRGLLLTVYQNRRWDGDFRTLQRILADESLGGVHRFESRFERWRPEPKPGWRESSAPDDAGGLLYDIGSHLIDQAVHLFGPVTTVYAEVRTVRPQAVVDDDVFLALTHASGIQSHLFTSLSVAHPGPRFRMLGQRAIYTKWGLDVQEEALRRGERPGVTDWGAEPEEQWGILDDGTQARRIPTERGAYQNFYAGVAAALRTGAPAPVDPGDAVRTLEIIERARGTRP